MATLALMSSPIAAHQAHLLFETDPQNGLSGQLTLFSYDSLTSLLNNTGGVTVSPLPINSGAGFSVVGFDVDNGVPHLLFETDPQNGLSGQLTLFSYDSLTSLLNNTGGVTVSPCRLKAELALALRASMSTTACLACSSRPIRKTASRAN